jgi:hypothetical protein
MKTINIKIRGTSPLLMHSSAAVDPTHPLNLESKKITGKRKKTDEDHIEINKFDFLKAIYFDERVGCYLPANNIEACLRDAAKKSKQGKSATCAIFVMPDMIPLIYDGPRTPRELYEDVRFRDVRAVKVQQARLMRCRPRFDQWSADFEIQFDEKILDETDIMSFLDTAGTYIGVGDFRPRYGRFQAMKV